VKEILWLDRTAGRTPDPCHLVWPVNQILRHSNDVAIWPLCNPRASEPDSPAGRAGRGLVEL